MSQGRLVVAVDTGQIHTSPCRIAFMIRELCDQISVRVIRLRLCRRLWGCEGQHLMIQHFAELCPKEMMKGIKASMCRRGTEGVWLAAREECMGLQFHWLPCLSSSWKIKA